MSTLPPPTETAPTSHYECPYCRLESDGSGTSCPFCGAPVDIRVRVSESGWERQPPIKDLARIQFGHSTCQVSGMYVPVAEMRLAAGESVFFSHHLLLWADEQVQLGAQPMRNVWSRMRAGMPLIMMEATGPGTVALSDDHAGETMAVPLMPGRTVDVREHRFLTATANVGYEWFQSNIWYQTRNGDETETHYPAGMYLDRFAAQSTPGLLLLHAPGNVFLRDLEAGQTICIHPGALVWKDSSAGMALHMERPAGSWFTRSWQPASPWLRVWGPGRVAVSSGYENLEGTGRITQTSQATMVDWNTQSLASAMSSIATAAPSAQAAALKEALDTFATAQGFASVGDSDRGPMHAHTYRHPGGIDATVTLMDTDEASSMVGQFSNVLGTQSQALSGAAGKMLGALAKRAAKGMTANATPVEGLGDQAYWRSGNDGGTLTVVKGTRQVRIKVAGPMPDEHQLAWARAFASAALGVL